MVKVVCLTDLKTGSSSPMTSIRRPRSSAWTVSTFRTTPSIISGPATRGPLDGSPGIFLRQARRRAVDFVGARLRDQVARPMQRLHRPSIRPPAIEDLARELLLREVPVVHVRDLKLAPSGGLQGPNDVEDAR